MVDHLMPFISPSKSLILRIKRDNEKKIQELQQPVMLIAGEKDEIVPHSMMLQLNDLANKSSYKEMYEIPEGMHNNCFEVAGKEYYKRMERFVRRFDAESSEIDIRTSLASSSSDGGSAGISPGASAASAGGEEADTLISPPPATGTLSTGTCAVGQSNNRNEFNNYIMLIIVRISYGPSVSQDYDSGW